MNSNEAARANMTPVKCNIDPAPGVPYDALPGLALHQAMKSGSVRT